MVSFKRLAYGKPKPLKWYGKVGNGITNFGVKVRQVLIFRPAYKGYEFAKVKK